MSWEWFEIVIRVRFRSAILDCEWVAMAFRRRFSIQNDLWMSRIRHESAILDWEWVVIEVRIRFWIANESDMNRNRWKWVGNRSQSAIFGFQWDGNELEFWKWISNELSTSSFPKCVGNQLVTSTFCPTHFQNVLVMSSLLDDFQKCAGNQQRSCVCFGFLYIPRPAILDTSLLPSVSRHICTSLGSRSAAACFLFLLQHACVH